MTSYEMIPKPVVPNFAALISIAAVFLGACSETIYHDLSEPVANDIIVALESEAIDAQKVRDPSSGDHKWAIRVANRHKTNAWRVLQHQGLPRPQTSGFDTFYPSGGLIPTQSEERILLQYATAQEIQKSLLKLNGIIDAHVHLVLPEPTRIKYIHQPQAYPTASVILKCRSRTSLGLSQQDVAGILAGAVEGLAQENVHVLITESRNKEYESDELSLDSVGPFVISKQSKRPLILVLLAMGLVIVGLGAMVVFLLLRRVDLNVGGDNE